MRAPVFSIALLLLIFSSGCKHEVETYTSEPLSDYLPLTVGKYITYQLDSTVYTNFGQTEELHRYQEKQEIAAQFTDNSGRPSYTVNRYLRDSAGAWQASGTFFITPTEKTIEVVENNLRTVRLALPIKKGFSWKGNEYLPFEPYSFYSFRLDTNFDPSEWDFTYEAVDDTLSLNGQTLNDILTVKQVDEVTNDNDNAFLSSKTFSQDQYAKGIGLVKQELVMWEHQPGDNGSNAFTVGFGVKRTMLDHN